jgi:diguanylate cyclase (GGDEF)-like protein
MRYFLMPLESGNQFATFYPATAISFFICGAYPGILSVIISTIVSYYFFFPPYKSFVFNTDTTIPILVFMAASFIFGYIINLMRDMRIKSIAFDRTLLDEISYAGDDPIKLAIYNNRPGYWRWNIREDTVLLSDICCDYYGIPHQTQTIYYTDFLNKIIPEDRGWVKKLRAGSLITRKDFKAEFQVLWSDGSIHWISSIGRPYIGETGKVERVDFVLLDIAEKKKFEHQIVEINLSIDKKITTKTESLEAANAALTQLSQLDILTGLANRRYLDEKLREQYALMKRYNNTYSVLMLDIDHFKKVNDTYGHSAGDQVLQSVATALAKCVRPMDTLARYGGEEFAVILPNCHAYFGETIAERIRQAIEHLSIAVAPGIELKVTVSVGGAYAPEWVRSTAALWTERADVQLYRAKSEGRNCVFLDSQQEIFVSAEEKNMLFGHLALGDPAWIEGATPETPVGTATQRVN